MKKYILLLGFLCLIPQLSIAQWGQLSNNINGGAGDRAGSSVSLNTDGTRVAIGGPLNNDNGNDSGRVYIYQFDGITWNQLGSSIDGEAADDESGQSVSISSDGNRVAIGAPENDNGNGNSSGHVRVYEFNGADWTQLGADIDGESAFDHSGESVSLSTDGNIVAIGASYNDDIGSNSGHVRIYEYDGVSWNQLGNDIDAEAAQDGFGSSVSLSSEGYKVAVGAPFNSENGDSSGHVRVYEYNGVNWTQLGSDINGEAAWDNFGQSVNFSIDGNRVAVGAPHNDGNGSDSGRVRVYEYNGLDWIQLGNNIDGEPGDQSGWSVSLSNNGTRVAIGNDENALAPDRVRIYEFDGLNWNESGPEINGNGFDERFGYSVSLSGDGNSVSIGAPESHENGNFSGQVRVHQISILGWVQQGDDIDGESSFDESGESVSLSADANRVAIGAHRNSDNGILSGHIRVYEFDDISWNQLGSDIDGEAAGDESGEAVSLNANGSRIAVGAPFNDGNGDASGHVRVYEYNGVNWIQLGMDIDGETAFDESGTSVSLNSDGSIVAVGAPYNDGNGNNSGHVQVYEYNGVNWVQLGMDIDGEASGDLSGWSVSLNGNGNRVAIGAIGNDNANGISAGHVRVYEFNGVNWIQLGSDINGELRGSISGWSVSLDNGGNTVAVGAPINSDNGIQSGHARVYEFDGSDWNQLGSDIDSEGSLDEFGRSVSLNGNGSRLAVGARYNNGNGLQSGHVRIFEFNGVHWIKLEEDIDGEAPGDVSGWSVSLSSDGYKVAIGAHNNGPNNLGHVRVYFDPLLLYTVIPDSNFEQALIDQGIDSWGILDGQIFTSDISQITTLDVSGEAIYDLTGIEDFTALEVLHCNNNRLIGLDVSNNIYLQELWCGFNRLSDLDVSSNPNLSVLSCPGNRITGLNLAVNVNLSLLYCESNQLGQRLDLRNLPLLADVNTTNNPGLLCIQVDDQPTASCRCKHHQ